MATFNKFNAFVADVANKTHNLGADTLKVMLTNTAPVPAIDRMIAGPGEAARKFALG